MVTVLHISDLQFGAKHRFSADDPLVRRILDDLSHLTDRYELSADLLVVSGDLAEQAKPSEFEQVHEFLVQLSQGLGLGRDRVVIVPGNHDVSWSKCRGYFADCEGNETEPVRPFWPKLEPFAAMFQRFYGDVPGVVFPKDQPWTIFEITELRTVIVGLNSVIAESHEEHYGWCGEEQLRSVADVLRRRAADGWLRIGVVHHNPVLAAADDRAALRDAAMLEELVAPHLHLLLHGHTHEGKIYSTGPDGMPVLCAGSAGVRADARADDVPNQYQLVKVTADGFTVSARRYNPARFRWEGDTSAGRGPEEWQRTVGRQWVHAHSALPPAGAAGDHEDPAHGPLRLFPWPHHAKPDDLLSRVKRICEVLRRAEAEVVEIPGDPAVRYLRVTEQGEAQVSMYPVQVIEGTPEEADVEAFRKQVDARYRAGDGALTSYLVYDGAPASEDLCRRAALRGISVQSLIEFQGLYDLRPYAARQASSLEGSQIYPVSLYVPQRFSKVPGGPRDGDDPRPDVLNRLQDLIADHDGRFIVVLGDFGHGKTFLLRELTRRVYEQQMPPVIPILIQLRELEKAHSLEQLLAAHLTAGGEEVIDHVRLRYLISEGRVLLLFDGFDELALRVTYERAAEHLDTLVRAAQGRAKVVLTSRTQYFLSDQQVETAMSNRITGVPGRVLLKLQAFTDEQILEFLTKLLDGDLAGARERYELIRDIRDLLGLSRNPRMLSFIAALDRDQLIRVRDKDPSGAVSAAALYRALLDRWLVYEYDRSQPAGALPTLTEPERWAAVSALAVRLWDSGADSLGLDDLETIAAQALQNLADRQLTPDQASHLIGSGTLLVRTSDERFRFVHRSVMEWLVASEASERLNETGDGGPLSARIISDLMADFVADLAGRAVVLAWSRRMLAADTAAVSAAAKHNAITFLQRLKEPLQDPDGAVLQLSGLDLRAADFTGADLRGADLTGADLSEARLDGADLSGANLSRAQLARSSGKDLRLHRADLREADLSRARLLGADLAGANLAGASLVRTCLIGAVIDPASVPGDRAFGAALPGAAISRAQVSAASLGTVQALAWHSSGEFVASADGSARVRIWDVVTGEPIRDLDSPGDLVKSVAWSPDSTRLAAAGGSGQVRIWDTATGEPVRDLDSPGDWVQSVAWSPDSTRLAAAGGSGQVRIWDTATGEPVRDLDSPGDWVQSVAWSPDSTRLAAAGSGQVRVWDTATGEPVRDLDSPGYWVQSVAWSPDSTRLAAGGGSGQVRIWDTATGEPVRDLDSPGDPVWSVAWSPDSTRLAAGGGSGQVRIWDTATGEPVRDLHSPGDWVQSVAWSPDSTRLAAAGSGQVRVWDTATGEPVRDLHSPGDWVQSVAWSPDSTRLAAAGGSGQVRIWDTATGEPVRDLDSPGDPVWSVAWSPDSTRLAAAGSGQVRVWDTATGEPVRDLHSPGDWVQSVAWSPDSTRLAAAGGSGQVRVWDTATGEPVRDLHSPGDWVQSVAWSPDSTRLAAAGGSGQVRVWDTATGEPVRDLHSPADPVWSVAWSPDSTRLAAAGGSGQVRVWDTATGEPVRDLHSPGDWVQSVAWSPDSTRLAAAGSGQVRVWDTATGEPVRDLDSPAGLVESVAWNPDGTSLAGSTGCVVVWSAASGDVRHVVVPLTDGWAVLGPDGFTYKYSGSVNGEFWWSVNLCPCQPGELDAYYPQLKRVPIGTDLSDSAPG